MRSIIRMLREAGAGRKFIYALFSALQVALLFRVSIHRRAAGCSPPAIVNFRISTIWVVDSLAYLTLDNLVKAIDSPGSGFFVTLV